MESKEFIEGYKEAMRVVRSVPYSNDQDGYTVILRATTLSTLSKHLEAFMK